MKEKKIDEVHLELLGHDGTYRCPKQDQLSILVPDLINTDSNTFDKYRQIKCRNKNGKMYSLNELSGFYDPLHFPLLLPYGESGFEYLKSSNDYKDFQTCTKFYQQILQIRNNMHLLNYGRLSKEYIADQWVKIEKMRLDFINAHQRECKAELYDKVLEFVTTKTNKKIKIIKK